MRLSVIIPYMEADSGKQAILERCLDSLKGANQIIVVENWKEGYAVPINYGLSQATGDFLLVMNDDLIWHDGSLKKLCDIDAVTSPLINGVEKPFFGAAFCIPRWVYEKVGGLYEGYRISYFDDDDYIKILEREGIPMHSVPSVDAEHPEGGRTLHTFPDHDEFYKENLIIFQNRWK